MLSILRNIYSYLVAQPDDEIDKTDEEHFAQELLHLNFENIENDIYEDDRSRSTTPPQSNCFERTGTVTYLADDHGLIDGMIYFDKDCTSISLSLQEKVRYLAYKNENDESLKVIKVLQTLGSLWDDEESASDEKKIYTKEHLMIGKVDCRDKRSVIMKEDDIKFDLDNIQCTIIPIKGDWLELTCKIQWDEESSTIQEKRVLEVLSVRPLRSRITNAKIAQWDGNKGSCSGQIFFNKSSCPSGFVPLIGSKVVVEAIESDQGACTWRAITLVPDDTLSTVNNEVTVENDEEATSYTLENEKDLFISKCITLNNVDYNKRKTTTLDITNNSVKTYILLKWKLMSSRHLSQVIIEPVINRRTLLNPNKSLKFTVTCTPKVLGNSRELFLLIFVGFQVKRYININVVDSHIQPGFELDLKQTLEPYESQNYIDSLIDIQRRKHIKPIVSGGRLVKPAAFVPVKLAGFPIPNKMWDAVLGDSDTTIYSKEFSAILQRIEATVPSLTSQLTIRNYTDRWHALLYIEEIQQNVQMRKYDMAQAFLTPTDNYLRLEIQGLSEKRPSLMRGDRVLVKDIWDSNIPDFEGYIHDIRGDNVYLKFNPQFHERYTGYDVKLEFNFSRTGHRRCHQAVNLAITHLGPDILFPSRTINNEPQVTREQINNISWYNEKLNSGQKEAIKNIIEGASRPMPYCIFGPPGTGKTMTVVETVLQILNIIPDSRILIATPSNSSANLLAERLLQYENKLSGSLIRLIAHYLVDSDTLPDVLKPYCATLDIARENTAKSNYSVNNSGINLSCRSTFVGRHRVTIGTCGCLGVLAQMELPRGHFTHVIVDEAGQATEPEIMIPMTFIDKDSGQIVLAGDPLQLGPVVMSKYASEFGFGLSYLERLLERVPYQKDFDAFGEDAYDNRLVTRLTFNYRSVPEVIGLSSEMFYDSSLLSQVKNEDEWVTNLLGHIGDILPRPENDTVKKGGIFMYGVKGTNARAVDSPSWYNPQEATMLMLTCCKLYKKYVVPDQIGIITPYIAQNKYLRKLFESSGTPQPKIGTVEEFQGQERHIILMSTVRSSEMHLEQDYRFALGFVKSPKRLNVALTRAQVAVILFGDPHLLCRDAMWRKVITHVVTHAQYSGCNLPAEFDEN